MMGDEEGLTEQEREFRRQCSRFLTQLGNASDESGASEPLDSLLEHSIRLQLPEALALYNAASRSLAAHLLLAVNAHYLTNSQTEEEFLNLMKAQVRERRVCACTFALLPLFQVSCSLFLFSVCVFSVLFRPTPAPCVSPSPP